MDTTKDRETGRPDLPSHTRRTPPGQDRRRAAWIILAIVAAAVVIGMAMGAFQSGTGTPQGQAAGSASPSTAAVAPPARQGGA
ncbi:hypothetical protein [Acidovorax sp. FG27]|uniref:hypothetical protein n=1 Tax=Acidovorax sp. FG27 TaxID=3133652 RepID=UPI00333FCB02